MSRFNSSIAAVCASLALAAPIRAQERDRIMGLQVRATLPMDNLSDLVGRRPGAGATLHAEQTIDEDWRWRLGLGFDVWPRGNSLSQPGMKGFAHVEHLDLEGLYFLSPDDAEVRTGPYLTTGFSFASWSIQRDDTTIGISTTRRVTHAAGSFGFGYRVSSRLDFELKLFYGKVDSDFGAGILSAGITYRF